MRTVKEFLVAAKNVLAENEWIKNQLCLDKNNKGVSLTEKDACKFCLMGAMYRTLYTNKRDPLRLFDKSCILLRSLAQTHCLAKWNDSPKRTKEEVLNLLERAIANAN